MSWIEDASSYVSGEYINVFDLWMCMDKSVIKLEAQGVTDRSPEYN